MNNCIVNYDTHDILLHSKWYTLQLPVHVPINRLSLTTKSSIIVPIGGILEHDMLPRRDPPLRFQEERHYNTHHRQKQHTQDQFGSKLKTVKISKGEGGFVREYDLENEKDEPGDGTQDE